MRLDGPFVICRGCGVLFESNLYTRCFRCRSKLGKWDMRGRV